MANQAHLDMLMKQSVHAWNNWRKAQSGGIPPDLSKADLKGEHLFSSLSPFFFHASQSITPHLILRLLFSGDY